MDSGGARTCRFGSMKSGGGGRLCVSETASFLRETDELHSVVESAA